MTPMNTVIETSIGRPFLRPVIIPVALVLACFALMPRAQAGGQSRPSPTPSPTPSTQDVNVVNTPTIQDIDNPAKQPFQAWESTGWVDGNCDGQVILTTVPAGKRLVIEHVSVEGTLLHELGHHLVEAHIETTVGGIPVPHHLSVMNYSTGLAECSGNDIVVGVGEMRFYADPGTVVYGFAARDSASGNNDSFAFSISGYFVDCPICP